MQAMQGVFRRRRCGLPRILHIKSGFVCGPTLPDDRLRQHSLELLSYRTSCCPPISPPNQLIMRFPVNFRVVGTESAMPFQGSVSNFTDSSPFSPLHDNSAHHNYWELLCDWMYRTHSTSRCHRFRRLFPDPSRWVAG